MCYDKDDDDNDERHIPFQYIWHYNPQAQHITQAIKNDCKGKMDKTAEIAIHLVP